MIIDVIVIIICRCKIMAKNATGAGGQHETDNLDHSHLQQPVEVGVSGAEQIARCLRSGTEEVKQLLNNECDILFECRVCRSIFRALPNMLIHKRNYCCQSVSQVGRGAHNAPIIPYVIPPESPSPEIETKNEDEPDIVVKSEVESECEEPEQVEDEFISSDSDYSTKTLKIKPFFQKHHDALIKKSTVVKLNRIDGVPNVVRQEPVRVKIPINTENIGNKRKREGEEAEIVNKKAKSSVVNVQDGNSNMSLRKTPPKTAKAKEYLSRPEQDPSSSLWRKYCNTKHRKCMLCKTTFANFRSLFQHMRNFHSGKRTFFRCLFCDNAYTKPQSLKRHMMKSHKKSQKQVDKMGELIRKNKFVKDMPNGVGEPVLSPTKSGFKKIDSDRLHAKANGNQSSKGHEFKSLENKTKKNLGSGSSSDKSKKELKLKSNKSISVTSKSDKKISSISGASSPKTKVLPKDDKSPVAKKGSIVRPDKKLLTKLTLTKCMNCGKMFGSMEAFEKHRPACAHKQTSENDSESGDEYSKTNGKTGKSTSQKSSGKEKKSTGKQEKRKEKSGKSKELKEDDEIKVKQEVLDEDEIPDMKSMEDDETPDIKEEVLSNEDTNVDKDSNEDDMLDEGDDDDDLTLKFEKLKKAGVKVDEKSLSCLMCEMQYSTMSSLIRHCIRHLGWRRFKCKYCRYTAYHKSECKSHLNRVHKMTHKNAHELNKCIIELKSDNKAKTHKINTNISPNQPVRTVKAFTKQTQLLQNDERKNLNNNGNTSVSPTSTVSADSSQSAGSLKESGIRITRSGHISQAPRRKYEMEQEMNSYKHNKRNNVRHKGKVSSNDQNSKEGLLMQKVLNQFGPQLNIPPDQNVQMQCLKIKSSDMQGQTSALKDLINKQENVQVVNHQGKKFYVVVMPKGQALPTNVTPTAADIAPEVINQALTMMKSPTTSMKPLLKSTSHTDKNEITFNSANNSIENTKFEEMKTKRASDVNSTSSTIDDDFELSRPSEVSVDLTGSESGQSGYNTPPESINITKPCVMIERLRMPQINSTEEFNDSPVLIPVNNEEFPRKEMKDSPPKLGAPYEVCESNDLISLIDDE